LRGLIYIPVFGMVFYFREKTTVYIWIPFFLFSSGGLDRREEERGFSDRYHS
jgi:hypothetical protein